jgi:glycosyltransferase involved in cell wall biosynthesis
MSRPEVRLVRWALSMPPADRSLEGMPVIVVGTARWTSPWLTEQNLAFALADRHPVLYVEPPQIAPRRHDLDGMPRLRRESRHGRELVVFCPVVLPKRSQSLSSTASAPLYRLQLRTLVQRLGLTDGLLLSGDARPGMIGAARERLSSYIVKDWIYADAGLLGRPAQDLVRERDEIGSRADLVLAISPSLQASLAQAGIRSRLLRHGFHADLVEAYEGAAPDEYTTLPSPRIVFAGRVDGRLDVEKLIAVARAFPHGSVTLIGPTSPRMSSVDLNALRREPTIHLVGARPREILPPYLAHADCLLIPYRDSVWAHHGSPLKLWDYLYAGPPIVGSGYAILSEYGALVRFANNTGEFVDQVRAAVADPSGAPQRRSFALANSWDERGRELEEIFAQTLASGG